MTQRIRQLFIGIIAVLSLSVSSVAACACSHHGPGPEPEKSCHSPAPKSHENHGALATAPSFNESCVCVPQTTKLSAKTEGFNLKKQLAAFSNSIGQSRVCYYSVAVATDAPYALAIRAALSPGSSTSRGPPVS